jgi:primosomal protein N'
MTIGDRFSVLGTKYDRRVKLDDDQRALIKWLREEEQISYNKLAKRFGVSKRLVMFVCNPKMAEKNAERSRLYQKSHPVTADKEKWNAVQREHRAYKKSLYEQGLFKLTKNNKNEKLL